jgi:hypothetical protein
MVWHWQVNPHHQDRVTPRHVPGPNHTPDNIYIHFPDHDTLMFIDVVNAGWVPIYNTNLSEDVIGYMGAPAIALPHPWRTRSPPSGWLWRS